MDYEPDDVGNFGLIITRLAVCYIDGYSSVRVIEKLLSLQKENPKRYIAFSDFLNHLYGLSYQSTILNLSNIINNNNDSVNIKLLSSFFEKHLCGGFNNEFETNIRLKINKLIDLYPRDSKFYEEVMQLRDKYIAHIDKQRFFHPIIMSTEKIQVKDLKIALEKIGVLIYEIAQDYGINLETFDFNQSSNINRQLDYLIEEIPEMDY
jgi:hypothetical protein